MGFRDLSWIAVFSAFKKRPISIHNSQKSGEGRLVFCEFKSMYAYYMWPFLSSWMTYRVMLQSLHRLFGVIEVENTVLHHWNENVFILMKSSSLAAPKVVKMTTFGAASDETFIKMMTFSFQWRELIQGNNTEHTNLT